MTEVSRRGFLKLSGTAAGAAAVSGSGAASLTSVVKTTNKIKPVKKLSTYAKAYRQFLKDPVVRSGIRNYDNEFMKLSRKWVAKNIAREAFKQATTGSNATIQSSTNPVATSRGLKYTENRILEITTSDAGKIARYGNRPSGDLNVPQAISVTKGLHYVARSAMASELKAARKGKVKHVENKATKRQLFGKAFRKLKGAIRGGFGGPKSGKTGIGSGPPGFNDPSRVSGYHY